MRTVLTLGIIAVIGAGSWLAYRRLAPREEAPRYKTVAVDKGDVVATVSATGTLEPVVKVLVGSQVSGTVIKYYADFNDRVKEDAVLLELDQDRYKAQLEQRRAELAVARAKKEEADARLKEAQISSKRIESAFQRKAASDMELDQARTNEAALLASLHAAEAEVQSAEANERMAAVDLTKTVIRSPIDGVVISRDIDEGQTVAASLSAPTLFTIANDLTKLRVNAAVSETDIGNIAEGMEAEFRVDAYPNRKYRGKVSQVRYKETITDNVVTYTTLIDVDNPDLSLRPGMTATILFETKKVIDVIKVPNAALRFNPEQDNTQVNFDRPGRGRGRGGEPRVYVLADDNSLREVAIKPGLTDGSNTQVASGELKVGDMVVTERELGGRGGGRPMAQRIPRGM